MVHFTFSAAALLLSSLSLLQGAQAQNATTIQQCYLYNGTSLVPSTNCNANTTSTPLTSTNVNQTFVDTSNSTIIADRNSTDVVAGLSCGACGTNTCTQKAAFQMTQQGTWVAPFGNAALTNTASCPSGGTCPLTETNTATFTEQFTAGISANFDGAITASLQYQWSKQVSTASSITLPLQSCQTGYMAFDPHYSYVQGNCYYTGCNRPDTQKISCQGFTPQKDSNGFARGNVYVVITGTTCAGGGSSGGSGRGSSGSSGSGGSGTCTSGYCATKNGGGPTGACCATSNDCQDSCSSRGVCGGGDGSNGPGSCPSGNSNLGVNLGCSGGKPGAKDGSGKTGACCKTSADCLDICTSGTCGAAP
jgi:hypothetical protein